MCRKLSIVLVEDDEKACNDFKEFIDTLSDIVLIRVTNDSYKAVEYVKDIQPDVVILDLELTKGNGNGLAFLHDLNHQNLVCRPFILITTNNSSQTTYSHARNSGADFILYKHQEDYCVKMVMDFLSLMKNEIMNSSDHVSEKKNAESSEELSARIDKRIETELFKVGISPKVRGFTYLKEAINLYMNDTTMHIAHVIAKHHKKSEPSVERAMQNALNRAWTTTDTDDLLKYYTAVIRSDKGVPTLMEFISYYANKVKNEYN